MSFPGNSQPDLNLEQQRKRAKDLRRGHRDRNLEAAVRLARHLPRARNQSAEEVLRSTLTLSEAQFVVAREAGFSSWPKLKHHIEESMLSGADLGELIINAAFAGDDDAVRAMLARDPAPARGSIHVAAAVADVQAVLALLNADPPLAGRRSGKRNWPPLLYLCCSRYRRADQDAAAARLRIAKRLIEIGADVNAPGLAVLSGNIEVLELLLEAGPQPWWQVGWALKACVLLEKTEMARILVRYLEPSRIPETALREAIRLQRHPDLIEVLLGDDTDNQLTLSIWRRAYSAAVRYGHRGAVDALRRRGIDDSVLSDVDRAIAACINGGRAELHGLLPLDEDDHRMLAWAIRTGRNNAVPLLLQIGLDPNVPDKDGETPLHLAVHAGSIETVDVLLRAKAGVDARNFDAETPLDVAVARRDDPVRDQLIRRLLEAGARPAHEGARLDREELNLLFERAADAVAFGDLETLRELLDEEPSLAHARSPRPHRATLLHYCGANGVEDPRQRTPGNAPAIMQLLLDRGAGVNATCNLYGGGATTLGLVLTSIHPLRAGLRTPLAEILLNAGAHGAEGIEGAAALGRLDLVKTFFDEEGRLKGNATKAQMQSALRWACEYGRTGVVEFLLDRGTDLREQDGNGQTALHLAAFFGHLDTVKLLLKRQAPLEIKNAWGGTVLGNVLWAAVHHDPGVDYVPIVKAVLEAGAKVDPLFLTGWPRQNTLVPSAKARIEELLRNAG